MGGNEWATFDEATGYTEEKTAHIAGTIQRAKGLEFWVARPRPKGYTLDEWEALQQEKWDKIFGKKEVS